LRRGHWLVFFRFFMDYRGKRYVREMAGAPGADALGCEIKEEASAKGRRRGTFAAKGIRTRRPGHPADVALSPVIHEEPKKHQPLATPQA
jgi:hypothetical protein